MEDGSSFTYEERNINYFKKNTTSENNAKHQFFNQRKHWEEKALSYFCLDIEEYAKEEFDLIDSDERRDLGDFDDEDIMGEAESRCLITESYQIENASILNDGFIERFVNVINRGDISEIESILQLLESKYKIA
ncbi:hypothetical protein [Chryseobacterium sp.]|uniref:hypothetical protein n=1 Tax=Chryseobacterium sp. TaxID=1871047 RepID=UPI0024E26AAE|nr:hypothetical protein [Chryseobacterium sp.]